MARIVFTLDDGTEIETELEAEIVTIGRHPDSIVVLPSNSVSGLHATIKRKGDTYFLQDMGTTNGTRLNGVEIEEARLEDGDQIAFGDIYGVFHLVDAPVALVPEAEPEPEAAAQPEYPPLSPRIANGPMRPGARRPSPVVYTRTGKQYKESGGCAGFFVFLGFLIVAFLIGLHIRHAVENDGKILLMDVIKKYRDGSTAAPPAAGAPVEKTAPSSAPAPAPTEAAPAAPVPANNAAPAGDAGSDQMMN